MTFKGYNVKLIKDYIEKENISEYEFCKRCGIEMFYLKRLYEGSKKIYVEQLEKICKTMGIGYEDLYLLEL